MFFTSLLNISLLRTLSVDNQWRLLSDAGWNGMNELMDGLEWWEGGAEELVEVGGHAGEYQKSKIKNQKSKIKNQKSKIKNQKSKIKNQKSKIKNQKSKIKNLTNSQTQKLIKSKTPSKIQNLQSLDMTQLFNGRFDFDRSHHCSVAVQPHRRHVPPITYHLVQSGGRCEEFEFRGLRLPAKRREEYYFRLSVDDGLAEPLELCWGVARQERLTRGQWRGKSEGKE